MAYNTYSRSKCHDMNDFISLLQLGHNTDFKARFTSSFTTYVPTMPNAVPRTAFAKFFPDMIIYLVRCSTSNNLRISCRIIYIIHIRVTSSSTHDDIIIKCILNCSIHHCLFNYAIYSRVA